MNVETELDPEEKSHLADRSHGFFGHPWGVATLSGVEMWERFSFYGMQALLAYYIYHSTTDGGLGYPQAVGTSIVGAYGGAVYLSAILGGWLSDRVFGAERAVFYAAILIMFGHLSLAFLPGMLGVGVGCVLIALGSGTLKTTTSTVIGSMYRRTDARRDAAFSIYYMGVNIGALIGPLLTGALWQSRGFHWGFGLAAVGMFLGLTQYVLMRPRTLGEVSEPAHNPLSRAEACRVGLTTVAVLAVLGLLVAVKVVTLARLSAIVTVLTVLAAVAVFAQVLRSDQLTPTERSRVVAYIPMFCASAAFWALFQQQSSTIAVYADERLNRHIFGFEFPQTFVQAINPFFIIVFAGVFAAMWTKWGDRQPASPLKFAASNIVMGCAFLAFLPFVGNKLTPIAGMIGILFLFTMAELLISPVGQSLATKLAPEAFRAQTVALHFLSVAIGSALAGTLAGFYNPDNSGAEHRYFLFIGVGSILVGLLMLAGNRWISAKMVDVR